jgi:hypothetical protein
MEENTGEGRCEEIRREERTEERRRKKKMRQVEKRTSDNFRLHYPV